MKIGKISNEELRNHVFKNIINKRKEVLVSSEIGIDTAVLDLDDDLVVISIDPITGSTKDLGKLSVNISCNDVVCGGAEPVAMLMSILLPPTATLDELDEIMRDAEEECDRLNLDIVGGHTEITDAVNRIVVTTTVIGRVSENELPKIKDINDDDIVAISKSIGIEGSSIIYKEKMNELEGVLSLEEKSEVNNFSNMLSVVKEAQIAKKYNVKYMHDITEGGLYGALWESAQVVNKKIIVDKELVPIKKVTGKIADFYGLDVYRLISSGSMVFILNKNDYEEFRKKSALEGIEITKIGEIKEGSGFFVKDGALEEITNTTVDELYKVV
ncbi:AIR synthase family protein [Anaerosphaera multitolerans]|uniref:Hydrogenase maturation protein n=1 Tax=Anaerosphaera multitolerans TaxID=2487351 RepID=A0A437S892_9FIRM|nr:AIR synthase family protein [Anaerosphaera multitolerans]RVU55305.1 hydrogenase maturation protein [Anaerosphaera multitolerans]